MERKFDVNKFAQSLKFERGTIRNKKSAQDLICFGYKASRLLINFNITNSKALQYILAEIAREDVSLN